MSRRILLLLALPAVPVVALLGWAIEHAAGRGDGWTSHVRQGWAHWLTLWRL